MSICLRPSIASASANARYNDSLNWVWASFMEGSVTKDEYANTDLTCISTATYDEMESIPR